MEIRPLVISAPFGNYFHRAYATSTLGTFTTHPRGGILWRVWRALLTMRYHRRSRSWINRLGLPNPGIDALEPGRAESSIVSIHGFDRDDWLYLVHKILCRGMRPLAVELNLSCPNVGHRPDVTEVFLAIGLALHSGLGLITKLPPLRWLDYALPLHDVGVRGFHLCNTIPTPGGGMSGEPLKQYALWAVEEVRARLGDGVVLIGGGGVTTTQDVRDYLSAGASHVAVGSMLLNPFSWKRLPELSAAASGERGTVKLSASEHELPAVTRDVLEGYVLSRAPELREAFRLVDRLVISEEDTLSEDFQLAAALRDVFTRLVLRRERG